MASKGRGRGNVTEDNTMQELPSTGVGRGALGATKGRGRGERGRGNGRTNPTPSSEDGELTPISGEEMESGRKRGTKAMDVDETHKDQDEAMEGSFACYESSVDD